MYTLYYMSIKLLNHCALRSLFNYTVNYEIICGIILYVQ